MDTHTYCLYVIAVALQLLEVSVSGLDVLYVFNLLDLFLFICYCCDGGKTTLNLSGRLGLSSRVLTLLISLVW